MADDKKQPIIVKKVIEEGSHGHHGGAWKVAYADFVTAMMAFFLLLWSLASSEEDELKGLADYFTPTMSTANGAGGDGALDGDTIGPPGTLNSSNFPMSTVAMPQFGQQDPMGASSAGITETIVEYEEVTAEGEPSDEAMQMQGELEEALLEKHEQSFKNLEEEIVQAMNEVPDLKPLIPRAYRRSQLHVAPFAAPRHRETRGQPCIDICRHRSHHPGWGAPEYRQDASHPTGGGRA
nr:flagellar motor protein MotB [Salipiger sp. CCB-MM3]